MHKSSCSLIEKFKKYAKDDISQNLVYSIIYLDLFLGVYKAMLDFPRYFKKPNQIKGQKSQVEKIAERHKDTLEMLSNQEVTKVNDYLNGQIKILSPKIDDANFYFYIRNAKNYEDLRINIGKRLERRLCNKKFKKPIEEFRQIKSAVLYEINQARKTKLISW